MPVAIVLAMLAHVSYAANDLAGAVGSRRISAARMSLYAWLCGSVLYAIASIFLFRNPLSLKPFVVNVVLAVVFSLAYPVFLYTVEKGNATINGVIAGTFPIWVVIFSLIFFDEKLTAWQGAAIVIIFVGVILSALHLSRRTTLGNLFNRYSLLALAVSVAWGAVFTFIRYPVEQYGWFEANAVMQAVGTLTSVLILIPIIRRSKPRKFQKIDLQMPTVNAITGFTGGLAYNYALTLGNSSIIAPIAGSYPGLYAVAAYYIFKEKLTRMQVVGIIMILIGVVLLSIASI